MISFRSGLSRQFIVIGLLRLVTGMAQFGVILFLAAALSLTSLGVYAFFTVFLGYFSQVAGFNFNTYLQREQGCNPVEAWPGLLMQQWRFLGCSLGLALVGVVPLFYFDFLAIGYAPYFLGILVLTVLNAQCENFMVGAGRPVSATCNLLLRSVWIAPLFAFGWRQPGSLTLHAVFGAWMLAELVALVVLLVRMGLLGYLPRRWYPTDAAWIRAGVKVGAQYTVWALLLLLTVSIQRVVLSRSHTEEDVGIFHFFYVISVFLPNLLEASLYAILLPKLIAGHHAGGGHAGFPPRLPFAVLVGGGGLGLLVVWLLLPFGLALLQKRELLQHQHLFVYTAIYALLYTTARIFHYQLYVSHRDRALGLAYLRAALVAGVASLVLIPAYGLDGAAISLVISGLALAGSCAWPYLSAKPALSVAGRPGSDQ